MSGLAEHVRGWSPPAVVARGRLEAWPVAAFAALLDLPSSTAPVGAPLPPLWHVLHLLEHPRQDELGADGHPADGAFLPPVPARRRMFAGGRLEVRRQLLVGDDVERRAAVTSVEVKAGRTGELLFVTVRQELARGGETCVVEEQDLVYRSQERSGPPAPPADPGPVSPADPHEGRVELLTSPSVLFRFSALTYNSHRIHYDERYATGVEGFPGLVVHGPLLALLLLEVPRRAGEAVSSFDYRLRRPVFGGTVVSATGSRVDGGWSLTASGAVTGTARTT